MFNQSYRNKKVLVTGNTGFKGSWLALWLLKLGAKVKGFSLAPPTTPNHHDLLALDYETVIGDVRDLPKLQSSIEAFQPEIIFHLAAQPIVRISYDQPVPTFTSNILGTINVLEASRQVGTVRAIVNITSDKCYENKESNELYTEKDPLGGYDPYSASKACAEIISSCYRNSFFNPVLYSEDHHTLLSSVRAGNVIGGGDWGDYRLIPDIVKATAFGKMVHIRNPSAVRPWQHVLEALSGYLLLGQRLLEGDVNLASAWNFGPDRKDNISVESVIEIMHRNWSKIKYQIYPDSSGLHEATLLMLDSSKARRELGWKPVWDLGTSIEMTASWYRNYFEEEKVISSKQLDNYIAMANEKQNEWL